MKEDMSGRKGKPSSRKKYAVYWEDKMFCTIRETVRISGLSERYLRRLCREGKLPGIYCGTRFMVNLPIPVDMMTRPKPEEPEGQLLKFR